VIAALLAQPWQLVIAAPFLGAALAFAIPHARTSWVIALLAMIAAATIAVDAGVRGLAPHAADGALMFSAPLIAGLGALCLLIAGGALRELDQGAASLSMALAVCVPGGWLFALLATDWIGFAVAVEAAWLAGAAMVALADRNRGALNGALRMLASGGVSAALMLVGVGFAAHAAGSVEIAAIVTAPNDALCMTGLVLVLISLAMKAGLAPMHVWTGAVFGRTGAFPAVLAGAVTMVGALALIVRIGAAAAAAPHLAVSVEAMLAALGAVSVVIGSVQAIGASNLRRLAAYAFASQAGCVLLSVSLGSPAGFAAALVQIFALAAAMLALLGAAAATRDASLQALDGLGRRYPIAGVAVTAGALSLMGAPLTVGFLGRWRLIEAAVGAGWWWVAGIALLSSLAAVFYSGRLIERVYFRRAATVADGERDAWRMLIAPALIAAILAIGIGVEPSFLLQASARAASHMFGGAP
jgi:formate hydrogenlyase subunit 3/multisubunit Na+/H+ antiporter MnhD subunit